MDPSLIMMLINQIGKGVSGAMNAGGGSTKLKKVGNYDPMQQKLHEMMGGVLQGKGGGGAFGDVFQQLLEQMQREFEEETLPGIAERFAGLGAQGGALSSSAFGQSIGSAASGFKEKMAQLKAGLQGEARNSIVDMFQSYLQNQPFSYVEKPKKQSRTSGFFSGLFS